MTTATEIKIIETTDATMEVLGYIRSDEVETAFRAGQREARKFRAQRHECECIGVVEVEVDIAIEHSDGTVKGQFGLYYETYRTNYVRRTRFQPVISPPCPVSEE